MKPPIVHPPASVARCPSNRQQPCARADTCARALAPAQGRDTYDFSTGNRDWRGACMVYMPVQYAQTTQPAPRVHDAPEGLR